MYKPTKLRKSHQSSPIKCSAKIFQSKFLPNIKWKKSSLFILFFFLFLFPLSSRKRDTRGACAAVRKNVDVMNNNLVICHNVVSLLDLFYMLCKCKNYIGTAMVHRNYGFLSTTRLQVFYYMFPEHKIYRLYSTRYKHSSIYQHKI